MRKSYFANRSAVVVVERGETAFPMQKLQKYLSRLWPLLHPCFYLYLYLYKLANMGDATVSHMKTLPTHPLTCKGRCQQMVSHLKSQNLTPKQNVVVQIVLVSFLCVVHSATVMDKVVKLSSYTNSSNNYNNISEGYISMENKQQLNREQKFNFPPLTSHIMIISDNLKRYVFNFFSVLSRPHAVRAGSMPQTSVDAV